MIGAVAQNERVIAYQESDGTSSSAVAAAYDVAGVHIAVGIGFREDIAKVAVAHSDQVTHNALVGNCAQIHTCQGTADQDTLGTAERTDWSFV